MSGSLLKWAESIILKIFNVLLGHKFHITAKNMPVLPYLEGGLVELIGNTPMIKLESLSKLTGCVVLAKLEYLNPGGSSKDRFAKALMNDISKKNLSKEIEIVEGTSGSTGISLSLLCKLFGYRCTIFMPTDQSKEKRQWIELYGADINLVKPASFINPKHYARMAESYAKKSPSNRIFADQFENELNFQAHFEGTGPEIYAQTHGKVDAVVLSAGTAGTIAGVSQYLKSKNSHIKIFLADPPGSGLYGLIKSHTLWSPEEAEGKRTINQVDSIIQGVGLNRMTSLLEKCIIDDAFRIDDKESLEMARYLLRNEGLFVGSSSALNFVGVLKASKLLKPGSLIVTLVPDSGYRHWSSLWSNIA